MRLALIIFFSITLSQPKWFPDLEKKVFEYFNDQGKIVTFSIKLENKRLKGEVEKIIYPKGFYYGRNNLDLLTKQNNFRRRNKVWFFLLAKELVPVAKRQIKPRQLCSEDDIHNKWIDIKYLNDFVVRKSKIDIIGKRLKYFKKKGTFFYYNDLEELPVIYNQTDCTVHFYLNDIYITIPAIALKNGSIGSKIKVIVKSTNKMLEAIVLDSKNVEVRSD